VISFARVFAPSLLRDSSIEIGLPTAVVVVVVASVVVAVVEVNAD